MVLPPEKTRRGQSSLLAFSDLSFLAHFAAAQTSLFKGFHQSIEMRDPAEAFAHLKGQGGYPGLI